MKRRWLQTALAGLLCVSMLAGCYGIDVNKVFPEGAEQFVFDAVEEGIRRAMESDLYHEITASFPQAAEAAELLVSNRAYYEGLTQNDLDFRLGKTGATLEEYEEFAKQQVLDMTEEDKQALNDSLARLQDVFDYFSFSFPVAEGVDFIKTTMEEEPGAGGYTHANQIYMQDELLAYARSANEEDQIQFDQFLSHELFHVISRNDPEFKENMYRLIGFTVDDKEPDFTDEVRSRLLSNPDVSGYNSHATFTIDGVPTEATLVTYLPDGYTEGAVMLEEAAPGLVPIDQPDRIVPAEEVPDFFDVIGYNTGYAIAAEEVLADNFSFAVTYGMYPDYPNKAIPAGILSYLATGEETVTVTGDATEAAEAEVAALLNGESEEEWILEGDALDEALKGLEEIGNAAEAEALEEAAEENTEERVGLVEEAAEEASEPAQTGDKSVEEIAQEIIRGLWGDGIDRIEALEAAGYDPAAVQARVNELMAG